MRFWPPFLLLLMLFSTTELHELLKLPRLWGHYIEHQAENQDLGFGAYLRLHYQPLSGQEPKEEHSQLPFKDLNHLQVKLPQFICSPVAVMPSFKAIIAHFKRIETWLSPCFPSVQDPTNQAHAQGIWHPPRLG